MSSLPSLYLRGAGSSPVGPAQGHENSPLRRAGYSWSEAYLILFSRCFSHSTHTSTSHACPLRSSTPTYLRPQPNTRHTEQRFMIYPLGLVGLAWPSLAALSSPHKACQPGRHAITHDQGCKPACASLSGSQGHAWRASDHEGASTYLHARNRVYTKRSLHNATVNAMNNV